MKKPVVLVLVVMKLLVVALLVSILFGCEKKNNYSAEMKTCLSYIEQYVSSEEYIIETGYWECSLSNTKQEECLQVLKESLTTLHEAAEGLTEECKNPQGAEQ